MTIATRRFRLRPSGCRTHPDFVLAATGRVAPKPSTLNVTFVNPPIVVQPSARRFGAVEREFQVVISVPDEIGVNLDARCGRVPLPEDLSDFFQRRLPSPPSGSSIGHQRPAAVWG